MKKGVKIFLVILVLIIAIWLTVFTINYVKCGNFEKPILMKEVPITAILFLTDSKGQSHNMETWEYMGLGYYIETNTENDNIFISKMYLFGKLINQASKLP